MDATLDHKLFSFINAFLGYNQIKMAPKNEEDTTFITKRSLYYYKMMPFDLKNIGATY